ncbi:uncharacterized protein BT62DRAFT_928640 [Guyanagaster necrorhizus]|uniref:Uncharacterized protein n=1 Tax=Guyanagaster necrorhizus TaxID=856835 RepID=A0A9P8AVU0_9AGAR|nr:uncharacterized protein BT62DRAFT_928640 [Guyanagaster necrorhizus MCA 3950]KAG7449883.1 hypothetical protein BT62DRAFT_928640 [Guyanagaster necrorhizus MCA 3950]
MVDPASFNSIFVAGQQVTQQIGNGNKSSKRASTYLSLPRCEDSQNVLNFSLGSPFLFEDVISGLTPSPRSLEFNIHLPSAITPSSPLPLFSSSFIEPFDAFVDSDASDSEDEDEDTQYISIPSSSPFYHPPPKPHSFGFAPWSEACSASRMSLACDALSDDVGESAAMLFHEKLDVISHVRDDVFIVDEEFLHEAGMELYVSPSEVFQDVYLDALKNSVGLRSLHYEDPQPDVPVDSEDTRAEVYPGILPVTVEIVEPVIITPSVGRRSPMLDRRLVAPFEEAEAQLPNHASLASRSL